jgi:hypothetical protein
MSVVSRSKWPHWTAQIAELGQVVEAMADALRQHPRQGERIAGDPSQAFRETSAGDIVRDYKRLDPVSDRELRSILAALIDSVQELLGAGRRTTARELVSSLDNVYANIAQVRAKLSGDPTGGEQLEDVIAELRHEYVLSLAVALSGQYAVVTKLHEWYMDATGVPENAYLDVSRFAIVSSGGPGRIAMRDLEIATHGGITIVTPVSGVVNIDRFSKVQQLLYGQWFAYMHALWDEHYRGRIAAAHGDAPDGQPWNKRDISIPLFGDIRLVRNDFIHKNGIADEAAETVVIQWFTEGQPAAITPEQMLSLLDMLPMEQLRQPPTRATPGNRKNLPWSADPDLVDKVNSRAIHLGLSRKTKKEIGAEALQLWLAAHPEVDAGA